MLPFVTFGSAIYFIFVEAGDAWISTSLHALVFAYYFFLMPPLFFWRALRRAHANDALFDPSFVARYGWLFEKYHERHHYWELTLMARRLLTVLIATFGSGSPVGQFVAQTALLGGALATAHEPAGIVAGACADLVVLKSDDPVLADQEDARLLDALIFSGYRVPIERVMTCGTWQVVDGDHIDQDQVRVRYRHALRALR